MSFLYNFDGYQLEAAQELNQQQISILVDNLPTSENLDSLKILSGRGAISRIAVPELGPVVIKSYLRGGLFRKLPLPFYLGTKAYRSQQEFYTLQDLQVLGISVPTPLVWIGQGRFFRRAWLVMKEITSEQNLADYSLSNSDELEIYCRLAAYEVVKLIEAGIWHIDLHPGNVLIGADQRVYLIDFDKACKFKGSLNKLRDLYICRWRRAILKYELPENLVEFFVAEVRRDYVKKSIN